VVRHNDDSTDRAYLKAVPVACCAHGVPNSARFAGFHAVHAVRALQVGMLQGTATALAVSTFRRNRTRAEQRRALQRAFGDPLDPGARFASVVQVRQCNARPDIGVF
jgi:hypothetical protein